MTAETVSHTETAPSGLPEGYSFAEGQTVAPEELTKLLYDAGLIDNIDDGYAYERHELAEEEGALLTDIAVRDETGKVVGFGGFKHAGNLGELGDFAVAPDHQHQGIGRAVLDERLRIAEEQGVTRLTTWIEGSNTLRSYYVAHGFAAPYNDAELVRDTELDAHTHRLEQAEVSPRTAEQIGGIALHDEMLQASSDFGEQGSVGESQLPPAEHV